METRSNIISILVKARGHGKSTDLLGDEAKKIEGIIPKYAANHPEKSILIMDTMDAKMYNHIRILQNRRDFETHKSGIARLIDSDVPKMWSLIDKMLYNCFVVVEDATRFMNSTLSDVEKRIILDTKQKNIDMLFVFHSLVAVPNELIRYSDWLLLGKTNDVFTPTIKNKWPIPDLKQQFDKIRSSKNKFIREDIRIN